VRVVLLSRAPIAGCIQGLQPTREVRGLNGRGLCFRFCQAKRFVLERSSHIKSTSCRPWRTIWRNASWEKYTVPVEKIYFATSSVHENCQNIQTTAIPFPDEGRSSREEVFFWDFQKQSNFHRSSRR